MLRDFTPRLYQETILATAATKNTLVVIPTGMGKTGIAMLLCAQRLAQHPTSQIIILAPTKPLVDQHIQTFQKHFTLDDDAFAVFTGDIAPDKRATLFSQKRVIFSTPQGLENDLISGKISLKNVSLIVFDEAHRATGDYSYVFIAKHYLRTTQHPHILALTASPGGDTLKIEDVCKNLNIQAVEIRTPRDPDVQPYVQEVDMKSIRVDLPEPYKKIQHLLSQCIKQRTAELRHHGVNATFLTKKDLLQLQGKLQMQLVKERNFDAARALSILAEIIKAHHALELIETQGAQQLHLYLQGLFSQGSSTKVKAVKNLIENPLIKAAYALSEQLASVDHPKIDALKTLVRNTLAENAYAKLIIFTQYRDTAARVTEQLNTVPRAIAQTFVGQAKKRSLGLSQKQQSEMLDLFRDGAFNVLVATSVAEEGLDIPAVDSVVFYEPVPSAIRSIQRRGRTGRNEKGNVTILITKGTRDEAYSYSAKHKEQKMMNTLETMRKELSFKLEPQQTLAHFESGINIYADYREKSTGVVKALVDLGVQPKLDMLGVGDYILSSRVAVELKKTDDFVSSIIDGRLLEQLRPLKNYERPLIIIQGTDDLYSVRNVHPNAIRGMLATIAISYGIPIVYTKDERDSAELLFHIAKREQEELKKDFAPHADRKPATLREQQEYLVTALPNVGPALARQLLSHFKSIKAIANATHEELQQVDGVGEKIANGITTLFENNY